MRTHPWIVLPLVALTLIAGCAEPQQADATPQPRPAVPEALTRTTNSGFLGDYSRLQPNPMHDGSRIERSAKLSGYTRFIIDTPKVLTTQTVRGQPIDDSTANRLAADLKAAAIDAMSINFTVTEQPAAGVARVRSAITQLAQCVRVTGSPNLKIGGASVEMEIVDSVTGERLAAAVESDAVTTRSPLPDSTDPYADAHLVFQHWAARLAKWINDPQD